MTKESENNKKLYMAYCPELQTNIIGSLFQNSGKVYIIPEVDKESLMVTENNGKTWEKVRQN